MEHPKFLIIKSIISDCICKTSMILEKKIPNSVLNKLANEGADKIIEVIKVNNARR